MLESLRIFSILLRKSWLVRKRHWITSIIGEILLPVCLIQCGWLVLRQDPNPPKFIEADSTYETHSSEQLIDQFVNYPSPVKVMYTPSNSFTDEMMEMVDECLKKKANITGFDTETELINAYLDNAFLTTVAIVFDEITDWSTKDLRFKLKEDYMYLFDLFNNVAPSEFSNYYQNWLKFVPMQICLDESFVKIKANMTINDIPQFFIQQMPYPAHVETSYLSIDVHSFIYKEIYVILTIVAFLIPMFIEISRVTNEKFVGMNVLMSINGISNALNLLSWITSGIMLLSVLCAILTLLIFTSEQGNGVTFMNFGNPVIVYFILLFHSAHTVTFGAHITAYFSKGVSVTFFIVIINIVMLALRIYVLQYYLHLVPYFGIIFPSVLLYQAMQEINSYETLGIQWSNLFQNAHLPSQIENSIGMILILSMSGTIIHFLLAIYVYTINPGKYGVGKNPLLFIVNKSTKKNNYNVEDLAYEDLDDQYFEPISANHHTPGIQIRNLKKTYKVCYFSNDKVEALRGISVDFFKGQITSLLGHNGAGKSTLMSILTGLTTPTTGTVLINKKNLEENASEVLKDIGFCTQEDMYFSSLTVMEQLEFLALIKDKSKSRSLIRENIQLLICKLKLSHVKDFLANTLSEDQKRKLCLGMAFVGNSSILVLDEPTARLDHESKRIIWDILLEMRDQKTILMSTHDMEEADMLGDRIAILQNGRLKSYGSSLYLKKMIAGQNNIEITLSIEKWTDSDSILTNLEVDGTIICKQDDKVIVSIPNIPESSDYLANLQKKKKDLGITGFSISLISLEQVFLKLTQEDDDTPNQKEYTIREKEKLRSTGFTMHAIRALFSKKLYYTIKNLSTILIQVLMAFGAVLTISFYMLTIRFVNEYELIKPSMYHDAYILYRSSDDIIADEFERICQLSGANPIKISNANLDNELLRRAKEDLVYYNNHLIAAAEFNKTANGLIVNAFYSPRATFSLPVSINLVWNTIIAMILGDDHSISVTSQYLSDIINHKQYSVKNERLIINTIFVILFNFIIAMFAIHPSRESSGGIKHLQKMTGVSGFVYWGTMFVFDLIVYAIIVLLIISGLVCVDYLLGIYLHQIKEILILLLLLMLFAVNALPIAYIFTFIVTKLESIVRLLTFIPMGIVVIRSIIYICPSDFESNDEVDYFHTIIFLVLPCVSLLGGIYNFYETAILNAICRKSRCDYQCKILQTIDGKILESIPYFKYKNGFNLKVSVIYLCATPAIYFGILAVLEAQLFQRIKAWYVKKEFISSNLDEQIQREKSMVYENIQVLSKNNSSRHIDKEIKDHPINNPILLAYELGKRYGKVRAVEEVSFGVTEGECFGIFGVNGSGKSVTLQMISGREIFDHGVMYIQDKDFGANKKYVLSQMGYCPQNDVTIECLNSYDHLRLFARLRGIPENQIEKEVDIWIQRLNLGSCASLPCSTYSDGNKQRLNLAIALIGNPKLVLLDEPTVGVDPGARHSFWNTIKSCQLAGQTFLVASHNMDECEALCKRTAVMLDGKLMCMGAPKELKQRFGAGYDVQIRIDSRKSSNQVDKMKKDMRLSLHCVLTKENPGFLLYHVIGAGTTWRKVNEVMNIIKNKYSCIDDFLVVVRLSS